MDLQEIIDRLCDHRISKSEAIKQIKDITDGFRLKGALEFVVEEKSFSSENNHGFLRIKLPYKYSEMEDKVKKGDKIDVMFIPQD